MPRRSGNNLSKTFPPRNHFPGRGSVRVCHKDEDKFWLLLLLLQERCLKADTVLKSRVSTYRLSEAHTFSALCSPQVCGTKSLATRKRDEMASHSEWMSSSENGRFWWKFQLLTHDSRAVDYPSRRDPTFRTFQATICRCNGNRGQNPSICKSIGYNSM